DEIVHPCRLKDAISDADALIATLPGTIHTERMIDQSVFAAARPGLIVVNVGRGTVIDQAALVDALRRRQVGFAALDVFATEPLASDSELWDLPNALISPHTAALNAQEEGRIVDLFADNARRLLNGLPLRNTVNTDEYY